jgi:hypothetical protein
VPGLTARVYEGIFPHVPAFRDATPVTTAEVNGLSLPPLSRDHDIGLSYTGWLMVPATGEYTFYLTTDTAAVLRLHDILVVDADFAYAGGTERASGPIALEAGLHPLRLHTRHADGPPELALSWSGPGIARQPVPAEALVSKAPDAVPVAQDVTTTTEGGEPVSVAVLAPDAPAGWAIVSVDSPVGAQTEVDGHAIIYTPTPGFFGTDRFGYTISDGETSSSAQVVVEVHYNDPDRLWLPFDEGTGERLRDAGGRPIATGYNGTQWVAGPSGHALAFDGAAAHVWVDAGYTPPSGVSARTVTAWIKADGTGSIVAWGTKEPGRKWHFRLENADGFVGQLRIEVEGGYRRGATSLLDGAWHHVAVVLPDGATNVNQARLYVDGFEDLPYATVPQVIDTATGRVEIGTDNHDTPRYFNGRIDEVRIHRRALPQSEITALAAAPVQTAAAWHMRHFGPAETNWQQDDGQTGFSRLQRLALGLHPWRPDPAAGPAAHLEEHLLVFTYQRPSGDFYPLEYNIELSHDLQEWRDGDGITGWSVFPNEAGLEHVEVRVPVDSDAPRLLRLRIDLQE